MMGTKWLAGTLLGLPLAMALCTLAILGLPGGWERGVVGSLIAFFPVWVAIICASVLFPSSRAAWLWLLAANLAGFATLWALRTFASLP